MTAKERNKKALDFLEKHDWKKAQALFYQNVKLFPSHQTYNNLGFYLITEGLICKNGRHRNALKLGLRYLEKASKIKESAVNYTATAEAFNFQLRGAPKEEREKLYKELYLRMNRAIQIAPTDSLKYNILRISYILNTAPGELLIQIRSLIKTFVCQESISFYLELLRQCNLKKEGLQCIAEYNQYLDQVDLFLFFTTTEQYEKGYKLCETVSQNFSMDEILMACIIECCVKTNHFEQAKRYWRKFEEENCDRSKTIEAEDELVGLADSVRRTKLISSYKSAVPFVRSCCYFGCEEHGISWETGKKPSDNSMS